MTNFTDKQSAPIHGDVQVSTRLIETTDNFKIALTRIKPNNVSVDYIPLILIHGNYSNRHFWLSKKGIGMAKFFSDQGYDVWIPEFRGHGLSPKPIKFSSIDAEQQIRFDLPAIQKYIDKKTNKKAFWIGHSYGGLKILASLSANWMDPKKILGISTLGSQITHGYPLLKFPPIALLLKIVLKSIGHLPSPLLGFGPEKEPAGTFIEYINWKSLFSKWSDSDAYCYWDGFDKISMPCLIISGAGDKNEPPKGCEHIYNKIVSDNKKYICLGKEHGYLINYGHTQMIVSKQAQREVWPLILDWIETNTEVVI